MDLYAVIRKVQAMEEERNKQTEARVKEEMRMLELEKERDNLLELVNKQQVMISRCVEKIEIWEARDKEIEDITETDLKELESDKKEEDVDAYAENVDYNASQDSVESFGTKVG